MKRLVPKTVAYLHYFDCEKGAEIICDGCFVFTLGQDNFWFVVQDAVELFLQLFRVVVDDVSIELTLCLVDDCVIFNDWRRTFDPLKGQVLFL